MEQIEFEIMEEAASLMREAQQKLEQLNSKDEEWNKDVRAGIDEMCSILTV